MSDSTEHAAMVKELQQLRRGYGLLAADVVARVGPGLAARCGLDTNTSNGDQRRLLVQWIDTLTATLPFDLRLAVRAALALPPADQSRFLRDRMKWLGRQLQRDPRTAMRRVELGLALLAEQILAVPVEHPSAGHTDAPGGWYLDSFRVMLMMHVDPVQLLESRTVTCTQDGLEDIPVSWNIPADTPSGQAELSVELVHGGELHRDPLVSTRTFWSGRLHLPRRLGPGEQHEFQVRVTSLARSQFRPFFVLTPFRRCDEFILRAKFGRDAAPAEIQSLDGVPFHLLDQNQPVGRVLEQDAVHEVSSQFRNLHQGLSYGLKWRFAA